MGAPSTEHSPFRQAGFVAGAVLLGAVLIAGVTIALVGGGGSGARPSARPIRASRPQVSAADAPAAGAGPAALCRALPAGSESVPTQPPAVMSWVTVGVMAEPSAPGTLGPQRRVDGVGECFAHNPTGALYAAANVLAAFTAIPQVQVISRLAAATPARAPALAGARVGYNPTLQAALGGTPSIAGFSFQSYSSGQADVDVVLGLASGSQGVIDLSLLWQDGDWRFVVPPGGNLIGASVDSLDGYVPWGSD